MAFENHFLDSLTAADAGALRPYLEMTTLRRGQVLDEVGERMKTVYLPVESILSVITVMRDGSQVESRTIGCESGYGLLHVLGSPISFERMLVQVPGPCWQAPLSAMAALAARSPTLPRAIVRHAQATILQASQGTACNTLHSVEARLCRWLLMTQDRLKSNVVPLTQEHLAIMLGVQRTTVTAVASQIQARGDISYVRGKITVNDRAALERCACECYAAIESGVAAILDPSNG